MAALNIKIEKIEQFYHNTQRGDSFLANNEGRPLIYILKRKKGTISGNHYHLGKTQSKNPETFVLISGKIELYLEDVKTKESKTIIIKENNLFEIPPFVYHEVKALTDFIALEFNIAKEDQDIDTIEGKDLPKHI